MASTRKTSAKPRAVRPAAPVENAVEETPAAPSAFTTGIAASDDSSSRGYIYFPNLTGRQQFTSYTRTEARRRSQWATWNIPPARKATRDLARWIGAVSIQPATTDEVFNAAVEEMMADLYERRPGNYDASGKFTQAGWMINQLFCTFRDGDVLGVHGTDKDGAPVALSVESALVEGARDAGRWIDGVLVGPQYRALAYNLRGEDGQKDYLVDAANAHLFANYETHAAARGTPALIHAIPQIIDYREIDNDVRKILKVHGLVGFAITREMGSSAPAVNPFSGKKVQQNLANFGTQTTTATVSPSDIPRSINEIADNGEIVNLPAGSKIETISDGRDFPAQAMVKQDIYMQIAMGLGVPVELLFMLEKLTGPGVRFVLRQAQEWRNYWLDHQVQWATVDYVRRVEWGIRTRMLPRPKDPQWWRHTVRYPRAITIDEGRDANAQIKRLEAGLTNWATEYGEQGEQWKKEVKQRIVELKFAADEAKAAGGDELADLFFGRKQAAAAPEADGAMASAEQLERMSEAVARIEERLRTLGVAE